MGPELASTVALAAGVAWASGINLYAAMLMLGILGASGALVLPADLEILSHPLVIAAAGSMYLIEFFADKTPGVDSAWDALHTFIRIPAGAVLAASAVGDLAPAVQVAAFIAGGSLAAGSHAMKTGTRVLINTSPEPVTNWVASVIEDIAVVAGLWAALTHPAIFALLLAAFVVALIVLLPRLARAIASLFGKARTLFRGQRGEPAPGAAANRVLALPARED